MTNPQLLKVLNSQGLKSQIELWHDFSPFQRGKEYSPYAQVYAVKNSPLKIMVVSGLPMVDSAGGRIEPVWYDINGKVFNRNNLFAVEVNNVEIKLVCLSDQPWGAKANGVVAYRPQLIVNDSEVLPLTDKPALLDVDPLNPNYLFNTLEWDYGICRRRLRIVEGRIHGYWIFDKDPKATIHIRYNQQQGSFRLKLGSYAVSYDEEVLTSQQFNFIVLEHGGLPVILHDSVAFYPDANPETATVDGGATREDANAVAWSTLVNMPGNSAEDSNTLGRFVRIRCSSQINKWNDIWRNPLLFNTASLPDNATILSAVLSLFGNSKQDDIGVEPDLNIYSSNPISNTAIVAGDYNIARWGSTPLSSAIAYTDWNTIGYNNFTLNDAGLAVISKTGITKLGTRNANYDVSVQTPSAWVNAAFSLVYGYLSEQGEGYKPTLTITYSTPKRSHTYIIY